MMTMASASSSSADVASSSTAPPPAAAAETRPEAGPLPKKRGEIGYREEIHSVADTEERDRDPEIALPERHPADRDSPPTATSNTASSPTFSHPTPASDANSSTTSLAKPKKQCFRLWKKVPTYGGIRLNTLLAFLIQLSLVGGTIAAWALSVVLIGKRTKKSQEEGQNVTNTSAIFLHVVFAIAVLGQLLFLERRVFRLRAERYAFLHPGEMLPTSRNRFVSSAIALSPWNRPPLPTYAAALAQSGVGTGDVEDHLIAQPPPPAYGNTRGSTFILSGYLSDSLRAQRPVSERTEMSEADRPKSYTSHDEEWEVIQDAERARRLEETLSRLERPTS